MSRGGAAQSLKSSHALLREHLLVYSRPVRRSLQSEILRAGTDLRRRLSQDVLMPVVARCASRGNPARVGSKARRPGADRRYSSYAAALAPGAGRARLTDLTALRPELPAPLVLVIPSSWQRVRVSVG